MTAAPSASTVTASGRTASSVARFPVKTVSGLAERRTLLPAGIGRKHERHARSLAPVELQLAVHQLCQLMRNRKAEPAPRGPRPLAPVEALEDLLALIDRNAGAIVGHLERDPAAERTG